MSNENEESNPSPAVAAIDFALQPDSDGLEFLRVWFHGDFDAIRKEWPEAPESVFIGADPLHPKTTAPGNESEETSQSDLNAENARLRAELETLKRHQAHVVATAIREAIEETRVAFSEGGEKWLCRVTDLETYAEELADKPVGAPVPGGWDLERESENCITVHHPDIGCYAARADKNASVGSIILYHLADDLMEGR